MRNEKLKNDMFVWVNQERAKKASKAFHMLLSTSLEKTNKKKMNIGNAKKGGKMAFFNVRSEDKIVHHTF